MSHAQIKSEKNSNDNTQTQQMHQEILNPNIITVCDMQMRVPERRFVSKEKFVKGALIVFAITIGVAISVCVGVKFSSEDSLHDSSNFLAKFIFDNGTVEKFGTSGFLARYDLLITNQHGFFQDPGVSLSKVRIGGSTEHNYEDGLEIPASDLEYELDPDFETSGDILFIKLKKPIDPSNGIKPLKLPSREFEISGKLIAPKWSVHDNINMAYHEVIAEKVTDDECKRIYSPNSDSFDFNRNFCAKIGLIQKGNSGMPLFTVDEKGNKIPLGLLSRGPTREVMWPCHFVKIYPYSHEDSQSQNKPNY